MTHARKPAAPPHVPPDFEPPWLKPPYFQRPPAAPTAPVDREELAGHRGFADFAGIATVCREPECRKAKRCCAPRAASVFFPSRSLPPCIAGVYDDMYYPVAEFNAFRRWLDEVVAKFEAMQKDGAHPKG